MFDSLKIGDISSLDFGASLAKRVIKAPAKKVIKETVPFSNVTYDFSKINGELYWEWRELEYVFEILADSPEELEEKKTAFSGWVMNVMEENIYDPYEPDFHYLGTFESLEYEDEDNVEKTTVSVVFSAYPYKIANEQTVLTVTLGTTDTEVSIVNESAHRVMPVVSAEKDLQIEKDGVVFRIPFGESSDDVFTLKSGENPVTFKPIETTYLEYLYGTNYNYERDQKFYKTLTLNEDGTYTLSSEVVISNAYEAVGLWTKSGAKLEKIISANSATSVKAACYDVLLGCPESNVISFRFNREVF